MKKLILDEKNKKMKKIMKKIKFYLHMSEKCITFARLS